MAGTRLRTTLGALEWNLSTLRARAVLREIESGKTPRSVLTFVPLFNGGDRPGILKKWRQLADQETDKERRKTLGLATVFAEASGCADLWREALKEWDRIESKIVKEWTAQARQEGKKEGKKEGIREGEIGGVVRSLLDVLESRFDPPPADLAKAIKSCNDLEQLRQGTRQASKASSLAQFRQDAGL